MNYRTIKNSKHHLLHHHFFESITHNKDSVPSLNLAKYFSKLSEFISKSLFTPTNYVHDPRTDNWNPKNDNYYFRDITDLKLQSSRRTFL